eukprot:PhM_4_TR10015/c0_g1_i1/m.34863/K01883/CARS, cysS; cysteinyl-tRNA synthetase
MRRFSRRTTTALLNNYYLRPTLVTALRSISQMSCPQCPVNVAGLTDSVKRDRHPVWYPPTGGDNKPKTLHVLNSLTETLEPFVPLDGRNVKWYTCGPTVYDSSHMGHARAYLTFDIIRRIMQDYFHYNIVYQMNITDIDDKIIKRARINKLLDDYLKEKTTFEAVMPDAREALASAEAALAKKAEALAAPLCSSASTRQKTEREEKLGEVDLKRGMLSETKSKLEGAKTLPELMTVARDVLGDWLDARLGSQPMSNDIFDQHARRFEREFMDDMKALNIRDADVITRVTEFVPQVVSYVQKIMDNGFAYVGESSVFFDLNAYTAAGHNYPKLKPVTCASDNATTDAEMAEGEGVLTKTGDGEKRNANDFALWKFSKPGEPSWDSPWGPGRPGWHIECSAMASELLGENMDIHGGGWDLKFPHHDNEVAQAEAFWKNGQWVNYFLHAGHLHIKGLKMAKSLKNFITIRQALEEHTAAELRMMFLLQTWWKPMNFSDQTVGDAREKLRVLRAFFGKASVLAREDHLTKPQSWDAVDIALNKAIMAMNSAVHDALCENFGTPEAIAAIMGLVAEVNKYLEATANPKVFLVQKAAREVGTVLRIFGLVDGSDNIALGAEAGAGKGSEQLNPIIDALVGFRDEIRTKSRGVAGAGDVLKACDALRDDVLPPLGIRLEDRPDSRTEWISVDAKELMREIAQRREAVRESEMKKLRNKLDLAKKDLTKFGRVQSTDPALIYKNDTFSAWGEDGAPTKMKDGSDITKSALKTVKKDYQKALDEKAELEKRGGDGYIDKLKKDIADLEARLQQ